MRYVGWLLAVGAVLAIGWAASSPERDIAAYIEAHQAEAIGLLERAVNINSGTYNLDGVRAVGQLFRGQFEALGFTTRWIDGARWERAGHLVAERRGPGPRILLLGHLDTVFERDSPFQRFERVGPTEARGPGVVDMKGGDVIIVQALKALHAAQVLDRLNLVVVMTGDEEAPGPPTSLGRQAVRDAADGAAAAIGFEDGAGDPRYAVTARRGATKWTLRVRARTAHSSQIFNAETGDGAIFEVARILNAFRERLRGEEYLTINPGVIAGGASVAFDAEQGRGAVSGKANVIAGEVEAAGDLRALTPEQFARAQKAMTEIVDGSLPHAHATLTFEPLVPPLPPAAGNTRLLEMYSRASVDLGLGPVAAVSPDRAGAADVSFAAGRAAMILDGVGLMGRDGHSAREMADLNTMVSQTQRAAVLLWRLSRQ